MKLTVPEDIAEPLERQLKDGERPIITVGATDRVLVDPDDLSHLEAVNFAAAELILSRATSAAVRDELTATLKGLLTAPQGTLWRAPLSRDYHYPLGEGIAHCRSCDAEVKWAVHLMSNRRMPVDRTGISHFATCPEAASWRK